MQQINRNVNGRFSTNFPVSNSEDEEQRGLHRKSFATRRDSLSSWNRNPGYCTPAYTSTDGFGGLGSVATPAIIHVRSSVSKLRSLTLCPIGVEHREHLNSTPS